MRKIKNIVLSLIVLSSAVGLFSSAILPAQVSAISSTSPISQSAFLGFKQWDDGINKDAPGDIKIFIWKIALNIIDIAILAVGYLAFGFILYGGFQFITSMGSSDKMAAARTTILNASVGTVLAIASVAIVRRFAGIIGAGTTSPDTLFTGLLDIFYFAVGATAVIIIIIAGFNMVTSGDKPDSVAKARNAILYASIGLAIVVFAKTITAFIIRSF